MHAAAGHLGFQAGDVVYWSPGHAPETLEDTEYAGCSPTREFEEVIRHPGGQPGSANFQAPLALAWFSLLTESMGIARPLQRVGAQAAAPGLAK